MSRDIDLFISYHTPDRELACEFVTRLQSKGLRVWFDEKDLPFGQMFLRSLEEGIEAAPAIAVLIGCSGTGPWQQVEIFTALVKHVKLGRPVFPVLLPGAPDNPVLPGFLELFPWVDLRKGYDGDELDKLKKAISVQHPKSAQPEVSRDKLLLHEILARAKSRIVISGNTMDKFVHDPKVKSVLYDLLSRGIKLTLVQLRANCRYAEAHQPYHELESVMSAQQQHQSSLEFFRQLFLDVEPTLKENIEVLLTSYMPRFRALIVDESVYLYFYMYGADVSNTPDLVIDESNSYYFDELKSKIVSSIRNLINAPEVIPYIRSGQLFEYWERSKLAEWESWGQEERIRHRLTHDFYSTFASEFDQRFGYTLEKEVKLHLDHVLGRTLILGCGSGKEVEYVSRVNQNVEVYGADFSHVAVAVARSKHPDLAARFILGDFYDLNWVVDGKVDNIVANAAFVHLYQRDDINELLQLIWNKLLPGGRFFLRALYKERDGSPIKEELDESVEHQREWGRSRWFVYYSRTDLIRRAKNIGFYIMDDITKDIAKLTHKPSDELLATICERGFPHVQYENVYWPTILLRKRDGCDGLQVNSE